MSVYKHGRTWWFEYKRKKPAMRVRKSTGFLITEKDGRKKAEEVFAAFKMGLAAAPKREAMLAILEAIYGIVKDESALPLDKLWAAYLDWTELKGRKTDNMQSRIKQSRVEALVTWARERKVNEVGGVTVMLAREYVKILRYAGDSNKTIRNKVNDLSHVWECVAQTCPGVHNPWKAVCPDDDGSSIRRAAFTDAQIADILAMAKRMGHGWHLASVIALYTGLRYGDIATLDWKDVDLNRRLIMLTPNKTRKSSGVVVTIPMADALYAEMLEAAKKGTRGFVLPEHGLGYATRRRIVVPFSKILEKCGIKGDEYTFHSWRHTANSRMAEAGVPSAVRQMICGWTNDAMARHYDHATHIKELTDAVSKI